ncbi:MAG: TonB-dependent receptor, partial [Bryobacterales bacterium]|nr:TonB-dependent receptor [Bryobacterales bacterium]
RFNISRIFAKPQTTSGIASSELGFETANTQPTAVGIPFVSLAGFFSAGDGDQIFSERVNNAINLANDFSLLTGRHSLKFGVNYLRENVRVAFLNRPNGDHTFTGVYTTTAAADFLLGQSFRYRQGGGDPIKDGVGSMYGLFVQDEFRVAPRLTLNLGLRYELAVPFKDAEDRVNGWLPGVQSTVFPEAPAGLVYPGDPGVPRGIISMDRNNLAPRVGIAYDLSGNGKTVLRGGWGMFYDAIPQQGDIFQNILAPPFNPLTQLDYGNNTATPRLANPLFNTPGGLVTTGFPAPATFIGWSLTERFRTPVVHHYNATLQQQLPWDTALEVAYVGARGRNLTGFLEDNVGTFIPGQTTPGPRENRAFALVRPTSSVFQSWYDGLQVSFRRRPTKGVSFLAAYTWSHALDHVSGLNIGSPERPQDGRTIADIKGNAQFDVRHRAVVSFTADLPKLRQQPAALRYLAGGWQLNGIAQVQTGFPFSVIEPVDVALRFQQNRPNAICDPNANAPNTVAEWFDRSCFVRNRLPADAGRFGTAGRNIVRGPGLFSTDLGLFKNIPLFETHLIQIRVESFSAWNNTNFASVVSNIGASNFGQVTSARNGRTFQFGFKYQF